MFSEGTPTMESLALGRVQNASMCHALELFLRDIEDYSTGWRKFQDKDDEPEPPKKKRVSRNPYRGK